MNTKKDPNSLEAMWETYQLKVKMDSIKQATVRKFKDSLTTTIILDTFLHLAQLDKDTLFKDSIDLMVDISVGQDKEIAVKDIFELTPSEIAEKYAEDDFWKKLSLRQSVKVMQAFVVGGTNSVASFAIKQLTPLMLLAIPFFALFLKLLYIRRQRYYIEHLVFILHINAFLFFSLLLLLLSADMFQKPLWLSIFIQVMLVAYFMIAIKKFYQQSWWKTLVKFFIAVIGYIFVLSIAAFFVVLAGIMLF